MDGRKKIIEDLLKECTKFTIPNHVNSLAYSSISELGLNIQVQNLKLSRDLTEEETLKFLNNFLPRFSKEVGKKPAMEIIKKFIGSRKILKIHYLTGYSTLALFLLSLLTLNFWISVLPFFTLFFIVWSGQKFKFCSIEGEKILKLYCIPLSFLTTFFWGLTVFLIWKNLFDLAILTGGIAFFSLSIVQFWSGPKVCKAQEKLKNLILSKF